MKKRRQFLESLLQSSEAKVKRVHSARNFYFTKKKEWNSLKFEENRKNLKMLKREEEKNLKQKFDKILQDDFKMRQKKFFIKNYLILMSLKNGKRL